MSTVDIEDSFNKLAKYCEGQEYKGYDPYDGLNSSFFSKLPILSNKVIPKIIWTQLMKRSPLNLRPLVGVDKEFNPKALGLFLSAFCNLYKLNPSTENKEKIHFFATEIIKSQNTSWSGSCWGYNFDWQARAFFQPKNTPTVVATTFIGCALLDAYELTLNPEYLKIARSSCDFIIKDLYRTYDSNGNFSFSYSPLDKSVVFNATLLGSRLLSRVYSFTKEEELLETARKSVLFACGYQKEDGSWSYGTYDFHQWIDNFHTGYNLECISDFITFSGSTDFKDNLERGFSYYIKTFFTEDGISKYYDKSTYPIDIHAPSQLIITLSKLNQFKAHRPLAEKVLNWTVSNMQDAEGYFYFQKNKYFTSKVPYMRWAQAWMFLALTLYFTEIKR